MRSILAPIAVLFFLSSPAVASLVDADQVLVSTISGTGDPAGISISSYVYFASGSSLTLSGTAGYLTTASSITGSAFFGDGSALSGIAHDFSTQTLTGANTFSSSFTIRSGGRSIIVSTSVAMDNISISTLGAVSFYPELHNTSSTVVAETTTTATAYGMCLAGSTVTIATAGGRVEVQFSGSLKNSDSSFPSYSGLSFLVDGAFPSDLTTTKGFQIANNGTADLTRAISVDYLLDRLPAAAHSFCVTIRVSSATGSTLLINSGAAGNLFCVQEIR